MESHLSINQNSNPSNPSMALRLAADQANGILTSHHTYMNRKATDHLTLKNCQIQPLYPKTWIYLLRSDIKQPNGNAERRCILREQEETDNALSYHPSRSSQIVDPELACIRRVTTLESFIDWFDLPPTVPMARERSVRLLP